jgi:hypothetical protein
MDDSSLLAVQVKAIEFQAGKNPAIAGNLDRFLKGRILEYVCNSVPYLIGSDGRGPLAEPSRSNVWERLMPHVEKIVCPLSDPNTLTLKDRRFSQDGIYILVSGKLKSVAHSEKVLHGTELPIVYVDLPGWAVCPDHPYRPESGDAVLVRIGKDAFIGRRPTIDQVAAQLKSSLPALYHYDVFLSYTFDDLETARRWAEGLRQAGLRVYMEVSTSGHYFRDRIAAGILDSLTLVALVSAHTMSRPLEENWVRREIAFRQSSFETSTAKILPVRLKGGKPDLLADGYTIIDAVGREEEALAEVIDAVKLTKRAETQVPFALERRGELRL